MNSIDPIKLQRLIDGELNTEEVQNILSVAQNYPEHWEEIATGFVEDQIWQKTIQRQEVNQPESAPLDFSAKLVEKNDGLSQSGQKFPWLAIAASTLIAAGIGFLAAQHDWNRTSDIPNVAVESETPPANENLLAENETPERSNFTQADYHLQLPRDNPIVGSMDDQARQVPLYIVQDGEDWNRLNREKGFKKLPPELLSRLKDSGYQMDQNIEFISGRSRDGRQFVVPVQTIRFLPGQ